jgi:pyruvate dehydrogenase E2 component (dihydrolipoamide acetyltransferase)
MNSTRRKLAISTWDAPREGNIYGKLTVDIDEALAYIAWLREQTGEKVTITHLVGKATALALAQSPGLNGVIRFGRYVQRKTVDIGYLVALEEGRNLAKAKIERLDEKSVVDVAKELRALAAKLHRGEDDTFKKTQGPINLLPTQLLKPLLKVTGYLSAVLGISVPALGLEAYPFGSCIITNVGVFGLDEGFAPPTPFAHVPVYVLVGAVKEAAVVRDGAIVVRKQLTLCATIDHRYMDGAQGGVLARVVRDVLENPWQLEGREGPPAQLPDHAAAEPADAAVEAPSPASVVEQD